MIFAIRNPRFVPRLIRWALGTFGFLLFFLTGTVACGAVDPTPVSATATAAATAAMIPAEGEMTPAEFAVEPTGDASAGQVPGQKADLFSGTWDQGASMPSARSEMVAVVIDGLIYVPGGFGGQRALEVYDPAADTWFTLADMPGSRHHLMATAYDGRLFVFGGAEGTAWQPTASSWVYNPTADSWPHWLTRGSTWRP